MSDKPVWMEEWAVDAPIYRHGVVYVVPIDIKGADDRLGLVAESFATKHYIERAAERLPARAQLAAWAPALVRSLLSVEWYDDEAYGPQCGADTCRCRKAHNPDCPVDAALTAAGFPTQESRDAARERMQRG